MLAIAALLALLVWRLSGDGASGDEDRTTTAEPMIEDADNPAPLSVDKQAGQGDLPEVDDLAYPERTLGGMKPEVLAKYYRFERLEQENRQLVLNGQTLGVLEELFDDRSVEEVVQAADSVRLASETHLGPAAADRFKALVLSYADYTQELEAMDEARNRQGLKPGEVDVAGSLQSLQDRVFGQQDSAKLFRQRRAAMELMEKHRQQYEGREEALTEKEIRQMQEEYRAIMNGTP